MENNLNQKLTRSEAEIFNCLAHPARLEILELLRLGEACVCHIHAMMDQRQAYISQQLQILRQNELVTYRKEGLRVYYQVSDPILFDLIDAARGFLEQTGTWKTDQSRNENQFQTCSCPQCKEKQVLIHLEDSRA